jgi:hypothetical protein
MNKRGAKKSSAAATLASPSHQSSQAAEQISMIVGPKRIARELLKKTGKILRLYAPGLISVKAPSRAVVNADGRQFPNYPFFANDSDCQQAGVPRMIVPDKRPRPALSLRATRRLRQLDGLC